MYTQKFEQFLDSIYKPSEYYGKVFFYRWYNAVGAYYADNGMAEDEVIAFLRQHPIDIARCHKYCPDLKPEVFAARHWATYYVPTTVEDAFKILDRMYPLAEKEAAIEKSPFGFAADEHLGLGLWIRNHWIYPPEINDSVVITRYMDCNAMLTADLSDEPYGLGADTVSEAFLEKYHAHLQDFLRTNETAIGVTRKPVKCHHCGSRVLRILYGEPTQEAYEQSLQGKLILGGCCINEYSPDWQCPTCGQTYARVILIRD